MSHVSYADRALSVPIRQLRSFESVAQTHSMQMASKICCLSQPTLSYAIAKLEDRVGTKLLDRRASGTYLNGSGALLQRRVERMFAQIEQALLNLEIPSTETEVKRLARRISRPEIRCLIAVVENGSFANAAQCLAISQSTVQRCARAMEQWVRAPLFLQTASGIVPSPMAIVLAEKLKLALKEIAWGLEEIDAVGGNCGGEIVVGEMALSGSMILAPALDKFETANPNASVRVVNGNAREMLRCLRCGDVDFVVGLIVDNLPQGLVSHTLGQTPYVVAARHGHPLLRKQGVTLEDLSRFDWVTGTPGSHRRTGFEQLFAGRSRPRARIATCSLAMTRILLADSDSLTLLSMQELNHEGEFLAALPFGPAACAPSVGVTIREDWLPTQIQMSFLELIKVACFDSLGDFAGIQPSGSRALTEAGVVRGS